jgi:hypothetical protein
MASMTRNQPPRFFQRSHFQHDSKKLWKKEEEHRWNTDLVAGVATNIVLGAVLTRPTILSIQWATLQKFINTSMAKQTI